MTATAQKALNKQLRLLRKDWKEWRTGAALSALGWWGLPWCEDGRRGRCRDATCEGCVTVALTRERTAEIEAKVHTLLAVAEPSSPAQESLFA